MSYIVHGTRERGFVEINHKHFCRESLLKKTKVVEKEKCVNVWLVSERA